MTRRARRLWFFTLYVIGCASVVTATGYAGYAGGAVRVPQAIQVVLGLLMVFVVPGWSLVCAAFPELQSWGERLLASVAISVTVATCAGVLLAAAPIGFSRQPFGELLGGVAVMLSLGGLYRLTSTAAVWKPRAWMKKLSIVQQLGVIEQLVVQQLGAHKHRGAQRRDNSAKSARSQQDTETDGRRSEVVLNFSFDGKPLDPGA